MTSFRAYLEEKGIVESSIIRMQKMIDRWLERLPVEVQDSNYALLLDYIDYLQKEGKSIRHINRTLITIGHFYDYKKLPNIAISARLKGEVTKALPRPIKAEHLDQVYQGFEGTELEQVILSLMIYQGLEQADFLTIETKDINLEKGTIYIPQRTERRSRTLALESHQILQLNSFIFSIERTTEKAFSPYVDNPNHFRYLLRKISKNLKHQAKEKHQIEIIKLSHLRQSRITIWVKNEGIRQGQYKAGFRRVLSAEKYLKADLTNLTDQIKKHHPFK